ncbi:hypothetical protein GQ457_15G020860 [Hibiscus cannabinus]
MEGNGNNGRQPADGQNLPAPAGGVIVPPIPQNNQQPPVRTVRDYLVEDLEGLNHTVTIPEFEAEHFQLIPVMFNMLNTLDQFLLLGNSTTRSQLWSSLVLLWLLSLLDFDNIWLSLLEG